MSSLIIQYIILGVATIILLYTGYTIFIKRQLVVNNRLKTIKTSSANNKGETPATDILDKYLENKKLYKIPILGKMYQKNIKTLNTYQLKLKPREYVLGTVILPIILFILLFILIPNVLIAGIGMIVGALLPNIYINSLHRKQQTKLDDQLPNFLSLLSNGLRAGLSLNQSISIATEEMDNPIKREFNILLYDLNLGKSLTKGLNDMDTRMQNDNLRILITAIVVQQEIGGNLAEIMDLIAETIRERLKLKRMIKTATTQTRMSALIITILPIFIAGAIFVTSPGYIEPLLTTPLGQILLVITVIMMITGGIVMNKITKVDI